MRICVHSGRRGLRLFYDAINYSVTVNVCEREAAVARVRFG